MPRNTGRGKYKGAAHNADDSAVIQNNKDVEPERKDQYLKRMRNEDQANKKVYTKGEGWVFIEGYKVLHSFKNEAGSVYTRYVFNGKRYKQELEQLKKSKKFLMQVGDGKQVELPLKTKQGTAL